MSRKKGLLFLALMMVCLIIGCSTDKKDSSVNDDANKEQSMVGKTGEYEIDGVIFTYKIVEEGMVITDIQPQDVEMIKVPNVIEDINVIEIDEQITFDKYANLTEVILPEGITTIYEGAFKGCAKLKTVDMHAVTIEASAFQGCVALETVYGSKIKYVGASAFSGCSSLKRIHLNVVEKIEKEAFLDCTSLGYEQEFTELLVENIDKDAFKGCVNLKGTSFVFKKDGQKIDEHNMEIIYELSGLGIQGLYTIWYRTGYSSKPMEIWDFYDFAADGPGDVSTTEGYTLIKCSKEDMYDLIAETFQLKVLKQGESISIKEINPILDQIKDDGNVTYTDSPFGKSATKYRLVDSLKIVLVSGKTAEDWYKWDDEMESEFWDPDNIGIDKKILSGDGQDTRYKYSKLTNDMVFTNTTGKDIIFFCNTSDHFTSFRLMAIMY